MTLKLSHVTKQFTTKTALKDISFEVKPGEIIGLIGQNGAGKSTTFRLILQFLTPTSGEITWQGKPVSKIDPNIVGYLPEERSLYPHISIEDQLLFFAELKGMRKEKIKSEMDYWLKRANVVGEKTALIKTLSKGNQQKIQLISTILFEPQLIILDEPFSGLDPVNAEILKQIVLEMQGKGSTIIFSSHRMEHVDELCDSLLMLKKGEIVLQGSAEEVKNSFGKKRIRIRSNHSLEELLTLEGVVSGIKQRDHYLLEIADECYVEAIFNYVTKDGFIPLFSSEPPTIEEIFKWKVGESNG